MTVARFWGNSASEMIIRPRGGSGKGKGKGGGGGWNGRGGKGGFGGAPPGGGGWPYGTDSLWADVQYMIDFRTKTAGTAAFTEESPNAFNTSSVTVSGGKLVNSAANYFTWAGDTGAGVFDGLGTNYCIEAWIACDQGTPLTNEILYQRWNTAGSNDWLIRRGGSNFLQNLISWNGTSYATYTTNSSVDAFSTSLVHYCHISTYLNNYSFINGVLVKSSTATSNPAPSSPARGMHSNMRGSYQSFRFTHAARYSTAGFTPDANFGKGLP